MATPECLPRIPGFGFPAIPDSQSSWNSGVPVFGEPCRGEARMTIRTGMMCRSFLCGTALFDGLDFNSVVRSSRDPSGMPVA